MSVGELCNRSVVVMRKDESARDAARLMRNHHVGDVVIVEDRQQEQVPVGIVTDRDLVIEIMAEDVDPDQFTVGDLIVYELVAVREEDELLDTLQRMRGAGVRRAPVINGAGGLEGILTVDDIVELLAEQTAGLAALVRREQQREQERRP